ncbi:MAG TPA: chemotaxis protein CheC [Desulfuromonadales bacterium]|nr:chemotaxis protein CheC [Desulfuromonadales bacterium]
MTLEQLTEQQLDMLKELSNIGMGHAATALSQMLDQTVMLRVPRVTVADLAEVPRLLGGAERQVVGITLRLLGEARGHILLLFPRASAEHLLQQLSGQSEPGAELDEMAVSTLCEVGNILSSAYLSAMGNLLEMVLIPSVPLLASDMAGAVVDRLLIELGQSEDLTLVVETEFHDLGPESSAVTGHFFLIPEPAALAAIFAALDRGKT